MTFFTASKLLTSPGRQLKRVKTLAAKIAAATIPLGVKVLTAGILEAQDIKDAKDAISDAAEKFSEKQFEHFETAKKSIRALHDELAKIATEIRSKNTTQFPIVVIVDELDRCRPTYAIELLEIIKHLFYIHGIVFVLGVDRDQLASSAKAVFGQNMDEDGYLRRFIDVECVLPEPDITNYCSVVGLKLIQQTTGFSPNDLLRSCEKSPDVG